MGIFALDQASEGRFAEASEIRMNTQVGVHRDVHFFLVLSGRLALRFDEPLRERLAEVISILKSPLDQFEERWWRWANMGNLIELYPVSGDDAANALFTILTGSLPPSPPPPPPPPSPPAAPPHVYGHLPFHTATGPEDVYYRYESFPTSRRINQGGGTIAPGTYAAPASELFFMPTGLSAVARQALPSLMPASWRWELQPVAGTPIRYGASVPLYGQSGGGVEVRFEKHPHTQNRGPIANPVVLPDL